MTHVVSHGSPHRGSPRHRWLGRVLLALVICLGLLLTLLLVLRPDPVGPEAGATRPCADTRVTLSADPAIAPLVEEATADLGPWLRTGECVAVDVVGQDSATTAAEIARPEGVGLSAPLPDLWLPDSSVWLRLAGSSRVGAQRLGDESTSVALSPVVMAMRRTAAEAAGWPGRALSWRVLLDEPEGQRDLATTDIDLDAPGLLSLSALTGDSPQRLLTVSRRLSVPLVGDEPPARLVASGEVDAIPSSEQGVIAANRDATDRAQLAAVYDPRIRSSLDFPLTTVSAGDAPVSDEVARAADVVEEALRDDATQDLFTTAGLRTPAGDLAGLYGVRQGVVPEVEPAARVPSVAQVRDLSAAWATVGRRSRMLVVVDRSGSMAETLPGSARTRAALAQTSLGTAIRTMAPDSDVGLWAFTTGLPGGDQEVLVPTGPLDSPLAPGGPTRRSSLLAQVEQLDPRIGGGTPLYDAVLAGFRDAQRNFAYGRLNALIVLTDGRNEDARSISLDRLLDTLRLEFDGVRPVRIIAIGYGVQADTATLRRITDITGGRVYRALTADEVRTAFAEVLADL